MVEEVDTEQIAEVPELPKYKTMPLGMDQFVVGAVVYVEEPNRLARVVRHETMQISSRTGVNKQQVAVVEVTLPRKYIAGLVSTADVKHNDKNLLPTMRRGGSDIWTEYWGERSVHPLRRDSAHNIMVRDESEWIIETAVLGEKGRADKFNHASSTIGKPLVGAVVEEKHWGK